MEISRKKLQCAAKKLLRVQAEKRAKGLRIDRRNVQGENGWKKGKEHSVRNAGIMDILANRNL